MFVDEPVLMRNCTQPKLDMPHPLPGYHSWLEKSLSKS